jgi:2-keto-4-pentenoate hydratase/2-oxohepta-3-ene-1,7-dioic acid hydratase in catechol pathway
MRLVSFELISPTGALTRIGAVLADGRYVDLQSAYRAVLTAGGASKEGAARLASAAIPSDMVAFIENGSTALAAAQSAIDWVNAGNTTGADGATLVFATDAVKLLSPIPRPPLIRDFMAFETHLKNIYPKLGRDIPPEWYNLPVYYKGNPSAAGAHGDDIEMPVYATNMDFEFEFAAVIGKGGSNISREDAMGNIFGFMLYNDFSAREIQQREMSVGLGPAKGKDFERGHVFGPWLVTADEIADIYNLKMKATVNGADWCDTSTSTMHWRFDQMIAHASTNEKLVAGEVFGSGTVGGGSAAEMGKTLGRGDEVTISIEGLGTLTNRIA